MLFNSFAFLFGFLPIALVGYQIAGRLHRRGIVVWLGVASLGFYTYWHPPFLVMLVSSILWNYLAASLIARRIPNQLDTRVWLTLAIVGDLGALCYFKYLFPLLNFFSGAVHGAHAWHNVLLPLGISFFTFTQIAYLVDLQQEAAVYQDFASYLLFVTFFPHLIAGPILHHKSIMPQFQEDRDYRLSIDDMAVGFSWFIMGLFKKVMIADTLAQNVGPVYEAPGHASVAVAWVAVLSYALQLYFDFSGYSDMALGLARMFSIQFPLNFASPYKSPNIVDYWNRWHMTLTQYITAYIFSPIQIQVSQWRQKRGLKISRKALATPSGFLQMIALPTLFTLGVAGVWHGAGFQFILFGLLHGTYLTTTQAWRVLRVSYPRLVPPVGLRVRHVFSVLLTFFAVVFSQIFFRSTNMHEAGVMLKRLAGLSAGQPITSTFTVGSLLYALILLTVGFSIVWGMPNTQQILAGFKPSLALAPSDAEPTRVPLWRPRLGWAVVLALALMLSVSHFRDPSTFLYFQF